jgi:hypothetical protein
MGRALVGVAKRLAVANPHECSNREMDVRLPDWWDYPAQCEHGHPSGPERVIVSWMHCHCPPAVTAARDRGPAGHQVVRCRTEGCRSAWYRPRCEQGLLVSRE